MKQKIRGKIIRIIDPKTVVINLGQIHGVEMGSIFSILGEPETIIDPFTDEELGSVSLVKGRVKAVKVSDKFTIASSKWNETYRVFKGSAIFSSITSPVTSLYGEEEEVTDEADEKLRVKQDEVKPWRALSEDYVQLGDEVEISVEMPETVGDKKAEPVEENNENIKTDNSHKSQNKEP